MGFLSTSDKERGLPLDEWYVCQAKAGFPAQDSTLYGEGILEDSAVYYYLDSVREFLCRRRELRLEGKVPGYDVRFVQDWGSMWAFENESFYTYFEKVDLTATNLVKCLLSPDKHES